MTNPLSPTDVIKGMASAAHPDTIEVVNTLLMRSASVNGTSVSARVYLSEAVNDLVDRGHVREAIFSNGMLDFEASFSAAGWTVVYNKARIAHPRAESYWHFTREERYPMFEGSLT